MFRGRTWRRLAVVALLVLAPAAARAGDPADALRAIVDAAYLDGLRWPRFPDYQTILRDLYEPREYEPLWLDGGRPKAQARDAIAALQHADAKGLDARDYDAALLDQQAQQLAARGNYAAEDLARFDVALSVAVLRHISDLHIGRVNPKNLHFGFDIDPKKYDLAVLVDEAVVHGRIREVVEQAEPDLHAEPPARRAARSLPAARERHVGRSRRDHFEDSRRAIHSSWRRSSPTGSPHSATWPAAR